MKNIQYYLLAILLIFQSCDLTDDPAITGTQVQKMAGEWFLQLRDAVDNTLYVDYNMVTTSNTAANTADKMWFLDHDHFFGTQNKMTVNITNLTFTADDANILFDGTHTKPAGKPVVSLGTIKTANSAVPSRIKIADGKILQNAARPPSGTQTDSMYMLMTGVYATYEYRAESYTINGTDTTVVWQLINSPGESEDGPYKLSGYRRTGFLEDEH